MPVAIIHQQNNKIAFAGNIRDKKLLDVITEAAVSSLTGVLVLKVPGNEFNFHFAKGSLIYATNRRKPMEKSVLEIIKSSGFISREKLIVCERQKNKMMKTVLEMLIDDGYISMLLYSKVISTAMRINVINAMLETEGDYSFEIRYKIDAIHGVRPITVSHLKPIYTLIADHRDTVKLIVNSFHSTVEESHDAPYLFQKHTFLHSAVTADVDFLKFFANAVQDYLEKKWSFQNFFKKDKFLNYIAIYTFRSIIAVCIVIFLYLAFMTSTLSLKKEEISGLDFYFVHDKTVQSLEVFQNSKKETKNKAVETNGRDTKEKNSKKSKKTSIDI